MQFEDDTRLVKQSAVPSLGCLEMVRFKFDRTDTANKTANFKIKSELPDLISSAMRV